MKEGAFALRGEAGAHALLVFVLHLGIGEGVGGVEQGLCVGGGHALGGELGGVVEGQEVHGAHGNGIVGRGIAELDEALEAEHPEVVLGGEGEAGIVAQVAHGSRAGGHLLARDGRADLLVVHGGLVRGHGEGILDGLQPGIAEGGAEVGVVGLELGQELLIDLAHARGDGEGAGIGVAVGAGVAHGDGVFVALRTLVSGLQVFGTAHPAADGSMHATDGAVRA